MSHRNNKESAQERRNFNRPPPNNNFPPRKPNHSKGRERSRDHERDHGRDYDRGNDRSRDKSNDKRKSFHNKNNNKSKHGNFSNNRNNFKNFSNNSGGNDSILILVSDNKVYNKLRDQEEQLKKKLEEELRGDDPFLQMDFTIQGFQENIIKFSSRENKYRGLKIIAEFLFGEQIKEKKDDKLSMFILIPMSVVPLVIGSLGKNITDIKERSRTEIYLTNVSSNKDYKKCEIIGALEGIADAADRIHSIAKKYSNASYKRNDDRNNERTNERNNDRNNGRDNERNSERNSDRNNDRNNNTRYFSRDKEYSEKVFRNKNNKGNIPIKKEQLKPIWELKRKENDNELENNRKKDELIKEKNKTDVKNESNKEIEDKLKNEEDDKIQKEKEEDKNQLNIEDAINEQNKEKEIIKDQPKDLDVIMKDKKDISEKENEKEDKPQLDINILNQIEDKNNIDPDKKTENTDGNNSKLKIIENQSKENVSRNNLNKNQKKNEVNKENVEKKEVEIANFITSKEDGKNCKIALCLTKEEIQHLNKFTDNIWLTLETLYDVSIAKAVKIIDGNEITFITFSGTPKQNSSALFQLQKYFVSTPME